MSLLISTRLRRLLLASVTSLIALPSLAVDEPSPTQNLAKVRLSPNRSELRQIRNKGFDIAGVNLKQGTADIIIEGEHDSLSLMALGITVQDIRSVNTLGAPDEDYKTPAEVYETLQDWARQYPNLVHLESLGKSLKGVEIWAARISNQASSQSPKPAILFNAEHHAREVMTVEVILDTGDFLLSRYGQDPQVTNWIDRNDIWLLPMVNPDGSNMVWSSNNMWRKNVRGNYGVDINRNYPYMWSGCSGSSSMPWAQDFHGSAAASEPETQAMIKFVSRIKPVFNISYHSYSEIVIYPYGCEGRHAEDKELVESIGNNIAGLIPSETGSGTYNAGTAWELLYDVDGSDIDWMYHDQHVLAYCIEVSSDQSGFQPPFSQRQSTVESLRPAWQMLLNRLDGSGVRGSVRDSRGRPIANASVYIQAEDQNGKNIGIWSLKQNGTFHAVLEPGNYNLRFTSGPLTTDRMVKIADKLVTIDVQF